jgi:anti-anti-sigma factor
MNWAGWFSNLGRRGTKMFSYYIENDDRHVFVKMVGDLDIDVTEVVEQELLPGLLPYQTITLDLGSVPFVDSTGIGVLINLVETLKKDREGIKISIPEVQPLVQEVFDMIQLREILGEGVLL